MDDATILTFDACAAQQGLLIFELHGSERKEVLDLGEERPELIGRHVVQVGTSELLNADGADRRDDLLGVLAAVDEVRLHLLHVVTDVVGGDGGFRRVVNEGLGGDRLRGWLRFDNIGVNHNGRFRCFHIFRVRRRLRLSGFADKGDVVRCPTCPSYQRWIGIYYDAERGMVWESMVDKPEAFEPEMVFDVIDKSEQVG